jgi:hypothetical protein
MSIRDRFVLGALFVLAAAAVDSPAHAADPVRLGPRDVPSVFHIAKSQNRNQVHYALQVDEACAARGPAPVLPYWRMFEKGPKVTEALLSYEQSAYGLESQKVRPDGKVNIVLKAVPDRTIVIEPRRNGKVCEAIAVATIDGKQARLANVYAKTKWPFGVEYLLLSGTTLGSRKAVKETLRP